LIAAVVLAAGASSRMGKPKLTLPVSGEPMLGKTLDIYRRALVDRVVVVLGANAAKLREEVKFEKETVILNPLFRNGMSGSLKLGLKAVEKEADAMIVALGDQPYVSPDTINTMIEVYSRTNASVVIPTYRGIRGNPVLFDKSVFPEIKRIKGDKGAKSVVERHSESLREVAVEDSGVLFDIDTPSDYSKATSSREA